MKNAMCTSGFNGSFFFRYIGLAFLLFVLSHSESRAQTANTNLVTGSTESEVLEALGSPKGKMMQGNGAVWLYSDVEVTFQNGKMKLMRPVAARPVPTSAPKTTSVTSQTISYQSKQNEMKPMKRDTVVTAPIPQSAASEGNLPPVAKNLKDIWSDSVS